MKRPGTSWKVVRQVLWSGEDYCGEISAVTFMEGYECFDHNGMSIGIKGDESEARQHVAASWRAFLSTEVKAHD